MRRARQRAAFVTEPLAVAIPRCVDAAGNCRQHQDDRHAPVHRGYKLFQDWPHADGLVLKIDILMGSADGVDVLVAIRELTVGDAKGSAAGSGVGVGVAARMDRPLHLGDGGSTCGRYPVWKGEIAISIGSPPTVRLVPFDLETVFSDCCVPGLGMRCAHCRIEISPPRRIYCSDRCRVRARRRLGAGLREDSYPAGALRGRVSMSELTHNERRRIYEMFLPQ